ncbi:unnamed protein product [Leptidea sinapis]|uniref:PRELI/MSF1 domain-containing protein n=1 Tax=Leptidea sinapis TaxID=189913 RepID=A0A5E4PW69_9NEOP|nr:unnamed protein product [Leptidea sinapis]
MARYFENTTVFNFSWDQVALGYWRRYPNPQSSHVLSEDTWCRYVKDGCLYTKRLLTKTNRVPKWGERFFNAKSVKIVEESIVDPKEKVLITYTRNLGYTKVMVNGGSALGLGRLAGVRVLARHPSVRRGAVQEERLTHG